MIKKILAICPEFNEEYIRYQPWKQIFEMLVRMKEMGIECIIGTNTTDKSEIQGMKILNLKQKNLRVLSQSSKDSILKLRPDVIYWQGNPLSGIYVKKNYLNGIPIILYVSTVHMLWNELKTLSINEILSSNLLNLFTAFWPFKNLVSNLNHKNISGIIVPNQTINRRLVSLGVNQEKIVVSPLFFESDFPVLRNPIVSKKQFTICYMGPSASIRGTHILLELIQMFKQKNIPITLNFLLRTPNPDKDKKFFIEECIKKGISDSVSIKAGLLDRDSISYEIINSDLIVIPTKFVWNEPPLALLEAMIFGKTIITTNVCGLPELIQNYGFTVNPDTDSFFQCIMSLYDNPKIILDTGIKAKEYVLSLPNWTAMANWTINTLEIFLKKQHEN